MERATGCYKKQLNISVMLAETPVLEIQRSTKAILRLKTADGFEGGFTLKYCKGRLLVSVPAAAALQTCTQTSHGQKSILMEAEMHILKPAVNSMDQNATRPKLILQFEKMAVIGEKKNLLWLRCFCSLCLLE